MRPNVWVRRRAAERRRRLFECVAGVGFLLMLAALMPLFGAVLADAVLSDAVWLLAARAGVVGAALWVAGVVSLLVEGGA